MLLLGTKLLGTPIMGLQTGTQLATTSTPIIDPGTLKIVAYEVEGPLLGERPTFIRIADVRELSDVGMIVDSQDEFITKTDVIRINQLYDLHFQLPGMTVINEDHKKLGKIEDYILDTNSFVIQQLNVRKGFFKGLSEPSFLIHRSQIVEINDRAVIVKTAKIATVEPVTQAVRSSYTNPFRNPQTPQANSRKE